MRVALINEGTYPYVTGGVSTWCDQLVRGLSEVSWHLVTIVGTHPGRPALELPPNVESLTAIPVWTPTAVPRPRARPLAAAEKLCGGMLGDSPADQHAFRTALRELAVRGDAGPANLWGRLANRSTAPGWGARSPLGGVPLADILLDMWTTAGRADARPLPRLTLRDADEAAMFIEHALRPLAVRLPEVDICQTGANGMSALVALAAKWRDGVPFVMTEHGVYLRERYLGAAEYSPGVKTALLRFHRALARVAYAEADWIMPVSAFNQRWEIRHGADPAKIEVVPNGVDPQRFPPLAGEPATPTISWVGRIDPLKDLHTLIRALARVREKVPDARLHLAGPVPPGNEAYARSCRDLVGQLRLDAAVEFAGPVPTSREGFAYGHIAALSSVSEGMPYTVAEAMMCGRPTVSTDVGGVAEVVGDAGLLVPPRDPDAFAAACVRLLTEHAFRGELAAKARVRALRHHNLDRCLAAFRNRYGVLTGSPRAICAAPADDEPADGLPAGGALADGLPAVTAAEMPVPAMRATPARTPTEMEGQQR